MEVVNTLDIDGSQWELQDVEARNDIATIKQSLEIKSISDIPIILETGYTATSASIVNIQKYGRLCKGLLSIDNISGQNIGTTSTVLIGKIERNVLGSNYALGLEYLTGKIARVLLAEGGNLYIAESLGIDNGNNRIRTPIIWFE